MSDIQVFSAIGHRHRPSPEERAFLVEQSFKSSLSVRAFAEQSGIGMSTLCRWRRAHRSNRQPEPPASFAAVRVNDRPGEMSATSNEVAPLPPGRIEIAFPGDVIVRIEGEISGSTLNGILSVLRVRRT